MISNPDIFRKYDIRGVAGKDLSPEFAAHLGLAYAHFIKDKPPVAGRKRLTVSVGWDCRLSSESYREALISGLLKGGLNVIRLGVCPTPLTYFSVFKLNLDGAIMITGSHNSRKYNGFKICVETNTLHSDQIQQIKRLMEKPLEGELIPGSASDYEIIPPYIEHLSKNARILHSKKIVIDAGNGTASTVAPTLFRRLGAEVVEMYCELDGRFPNHHPDPTVPENLRDLATRVITEKADFGVGFDGDSDRIGLVDETGRIIFGDELAILFSRDILKEHPGATLISEVKSSHRLFQDIIQKGGKPLMWKTGHSLIKAKMKETGALFAGEMSGHMFFADRYYGYDDALYAALRIYEILSHSNVGISLLLNDLPKSIYTPEIRIPCEEKYKLPLIREVRKHLAKGCYQINDLDGVRLDFCDGWGLIRASNTQAVLVMRFEASNQTRLEEIRTLIESALSEALVAFGLKPLAIPS